MLLKGHQWRSRTRTRSTRSTRSVKEVQFRLPVCAGLSKCLNSSSVHLLFVIRIPIYNNGNPFHPPLTRDEGLGTTNTTIQAGNKWAHTFPEQVPPDPDRKRPFVGGICIVCVVEMDVRGDPLENCGSRGGKEAEGEEDQKKNSLLWQRVQVCGSGQNRDKGRARGLFAINVKEREREWAPRNTATVLLVFNRMCFVLQYPRVWQKDKGEETFIYISKLWSSRFKCYCIVATLGGGQEE